MLAHVLCAELIASGLSVWWSRAQYALVVANASGVPLVSNLEVDLGEVLSKLLIARTLVDEVATGPAIIGCVAVSILVGSQLHHLQLVLVPRSLRAGLPDDTKLPATTMPTSSTPALLLVRL